MTVKQVLKTVEDTILDRMVALESAANSTDPTGLARVQGGLAALADLRTRIRSYLAQQAANAEEYKAAVQAGEEVPKRRRKIG